MLKNFIYTISKNHYSGYVTKEVNTVSELLQDLATKCVSPVSGYDDKIQTDVITSREWTSKSHRSNATIKARGNLGMIDFEGLPANLDKLIQCIESKDLWFAAIPSQSHKSDKANSRYHIVYLLSEPYSINAEAYKVQAKEFFNYVGYEWENSESGIDTRATFNACGYFSPTIPLKDAKSDKNKKIKEPYKILEDVAKDTIVSKRDKAYEPIEANSTTPNEAFTSVTKRGRRVKDANFKILRTLGKGYVLSSESHIETSTGKFMTFEQLVDALDDVEGENPRISMLGCPICNEGHTGASTIGYAYMQYDENEKPYIFCTGNACSSRPYFTMAEGSISVYRVDNHDGSNKYVMFEDSDIIYTHDRDLTYKLASSAVADELYNKGQYSINEFGNYCRAATVNDYVVGTESIQINHNPFEPQGLNIYDKTFTVSPPARFEATPEDADEVISEAIKAFEDDALICGYPVSLVYIAYYLFHHKQIMAVLALVNPDRGSGKSFWVLELPTWYIGYSKVGAMSSKAIADGWDDEKLGSRIVIYEDIEKLPKNVIDLLRSEIKSDATAGDNKKLNIKGQGKKTSFGFNTALTSNSYSQIPFDGKDDRRIYPSPYKMLSNSSWLSSKLRADAPTSNKHRTNAINFLYKIYTECEKSNSQELYDALYYKVPQSSIRGLVEDSTSTDGHTALHIIIRAKTKEELVNNLSNIIANDISDSILEDWVEGIYMSDDKIKIFMKDLQILWKMLPTGKDSMKSLNGRSLLNIFGIESDIKSIRINRVSLKGIEVNR